MNKDQKIHLLKSLQKDIRYDGRKKEQFRDVVVELGISHSAEGSARVKIGKTEVLAGVKMALEEPYPDTPDKGNLMVNAELLPASNPEFEPGPPGEEAIEISRVIDRGVRESKAIDFEKLCVKKGEKVWSVMVDICTINDDGNLLDASALAVLAALTDAKFPAVSDGVIDYSKKTDKKLPLTKLPITITAYKIGDHFIVDPLPSEELAYDSRLTVALTEDNEISAMQKGGEEPLSIEDIGKVIDIAQKLAPELRKKLKR
ncbi:RNA-binding protein [Candidatus Woesearchaeota archaeon]|nr:MAG: RNA-binding protein [Candidatus Woesearchaeota archaeon]